MRVLADTSVWVAHFRDRLPALPPLLAMEAMKMEHTITAPAAGALDGFLVAVGDQVEEGAALVEFRSDDAT